MTTWRRSTTESWAILNSCPRLQGATSTLAAQKPYSVPQYDLFYRSDNFGGIHSAYWQLHFDGS